LYPRSVSPEARKRQADADRGRRLPAERRRENIVEVARHAFAARGYDGVRTQELASAAQVSEALIYQHFASKRELYERVVDESASDLTARLAEAVRSAPDAERLQRGLEAFVTFVADHSSGWVLLTSRVSDPELLAHQRQAHRRCIGALNELFMEEAGRPRSVRARNRIELLTEAIAGGAEALATWWGDNPGVSHTEGLSMLVDFARRGLEESAAAR
jgi:AcrR family transcriptional regulator